MFVSHVGDDDQFKHEEAGPGHGHEIGFAHSDDRNQELGNLNDLDLAHHNPNDLKLVFSCLRHHAGDLVVSSNCEHDPSNLAAQIKETALFSYCDTTPVSCDTPQDSSPVAAPIVHIRKSITSAKHEHIAR